MLVLSRQTSQSVVFPHLGITVRLLKIKGKVVQLGIEAPGYFTVLRGELTSENVPVTKDPIRRLAHALTNYLNKINLQLHIFRRQQEQGETLQADETLETVFTSLRTLDRNWLLKQLEETETPAATSKKPVCKALIVEDDDNERELLAGLLRMHGADCVTAADGEEALRMLAEGNHPDIILLDMLMPRCDGMKTLQTIRHDPRMQNLRVYSISALSPEQVGLSMGPDGLNGWFPKPLNPGRLWQTITDSFPSAN